MTFCLDICLLREMPASVQLLANVDELGAVQSHGHARSHQGERALGLNCLGQLLLLFTE